MIHLFSFENTECARLIKEIWMQHIVIDPNRFDPSELLSFSGYLIWFGDYSRRDNKKLKVESMCDNRFRNDLQGSKVKTIYRLFLPRWIMQGRFNIWINGMGNWYCNNTCYLLSKAIESDLLNVKLMFIHVPRNQSCMWFKELILSLINDLERVL